MRLRFPLYAQILGWFFLNLLLLALVFFVLFKVQFQVGLDSLLLGRAAERVQSVSELIAYELNESPRAEWDEILARFSRAHKVGFYLFRNDGTQLAGEPVGLPREIANRLNEGRGPFGPRGRAAEGQFAPRGPRQQPPRDQRTDSPGEDRPEFRAENQPGVVPPGALLPGGPRQRFMQRTAPPSRYWVGVRLPAREWDALRPGPLTLLAMSESLYSGGMFIDLTPWIIGGCGVMAFSLLFWFPLVRGITRSISQITSVTEEIAEGRFDTRAPESRRDELGRLSQAVNRMAGRLSGFVSGQKRFLGDIAHELCSPIARMQMALGILEHRADEKQKGYVEDAREEIEHMSQLVNELLAFSKASLQQRDVRLQPVALAAMVDRVVKREAGEDVRIEVGVPNDLRALAEPELLSRALANLIRNALRYAGAGGPVTISAQAKAGQVALTVADNGPGVPEETLQQIFDPFFRLEASRSRDTGGVGLGLAIVKTCVEACQGAVTARNRKPSGLEVEITLKAQNASGRALRS